MGSEGREERSVGRVLIETTSDGAIIRAPGPRSRWAVPGLLLLLPAAALLVFMDVILVRSAIASFGHDPLAASVVIAVLAALVLLATGAPIVLAALELAYHRWGHETIGVTPWMLTDSRHLLGLTLRHRWPSMRISDPRLSPCAGGEMDPRFVACHGILVDVDGKKTRTIGEGCIPSEAAEVHAVVHEVLTRPCTSRGDTA